MKKTAKDYRLELQYRKLDSSVKSGIDFIQNKLDKDIKKEIKPTVTLSFQDPTTYQKVVGGTRISMDSLLKSIEDIKSYLVELDFIVIIDYENKEMKVSI